MENAVIPVTGLVLVCRRPRNRIGWLFLLAGLTLGLNVFSHAYGQYALDARRGPAFAGLALAWLSNWIWLIPVAVLPFALLLFPTGYLGSPR